MVQLDDAVVQVLPDAEADIPAGGREKCIFKFSSIRVPGLEGFKEREGCWGVRASRRKIIIVSCGVKHMPQTHDGGMCFKPQLTKIIFRREALTPQHPSHSLNPSRPRPTMQLNFQILLSWPPAG